MEPKTASGKKRFLLCTNTADHSGEDFILSIHNSTYYQRMAETAPSVTLTLTQIHNSKEKLLKSQ